MSVAATEHPRRPASLRSGDLSMPVVETAERARRSRSCPLQDICRSPLCRNTNTSCRGSRKEH
jgi:hypothetical protein